MTVKELIERLKEVDEKQNVFFKNKNGDLFAINDNHVSKRSYIAGDRLSIPKNVLILTNYIN